MMNISKRNLKVVTPKKFIGLHPSKVVNRLKSEPLGDVSLYAAGFKAGAAWAEKKLEKVNTDA